MTVDTDDAIRKRQADPDSEANRSNEIITLWQQNAHAWSQAVRSNAIESRRVATNRAILDAINRLAPNRVLDIGCGEGWLSLALIRAGIEVVGVDATTELIAIATLSANTNTNTNTSLNLSTSAGVSAGELGQFFCCQYDQIFALSFGRQFDLAVANFSLIGKSDAANVLTGCLSQLKPGGRVLIQTLHPDATPQSDSQEGWRSGSWAGCGEGFGDAPPWYFRSLPAWQALIENHGYSISATQHVRHPDDQRPLSLILEASRS